MFVIPGRESSPLLDAVEASFDDVALLVGLGVEVDGPPAGSTSSLPVSDLVAAFGDHGFDAPGT